MIHKDVYALIHRSRNMLPYKAKSNFTVVIKLGIWRWEDYPGKSGMAHSKQVLKVRELLLDVI